MSLDYCFPNRFYKGILESYEVKYWTRHCTTDSDRVRADFHGAVITEWRLLRCSRALCADRRSSKTQLRIVSATTIRDEPWNDGVVRDVRLNGVGKTSRGAKRVNKAKRLSFSLSVSSVSRSRPLFSRTLTMFLIIVVSVRRVLSSPRVWRRGTLAAKKRYLTSRRTVI